MRSDFNCEIKHEIEKKDYVEETGIDGHTKISVYIATDMQSNNSCDREFMR